MSMIGSESIGSQLIENSRADKSSKRETKSASPSSKGEFMK